MLFARVSPPVARLRGETYMALWSRFKLLVGARDARGANRKVTYPVYGIC